MASGWCGGQERKGISPADGAWHALVAPSSPFFLQSSNPTIYGVSLQNYLREFGHQELLGKILGV